MFITDTNNCAARMRPASNPPFRPLLVIGNIMVTAKLSARPSDRTFVLGFHMYTHGIRPRIILQTLVAEVWSFFGGLELDHFVSILCCFLAKKYGLASSQQDMNNNDGTDVSTVTRFQANPMGKKHAKML